MSEKEKPKYGNIGWIDLTVPNAVELKNFYKEVTGWQWEPLSIGDYEDFVMLASGAAKTGIRHQQGQNSEIPSQWMIYINVEHLDQSITTCISKGGKVISTIIAMGESGKYCFIEDSAGAVCALFEPKVS
jgi:predicted enzyme related to lactoylglutathione lyase